jgi:hypothetical protein
MMARILVFIAVMSSAGEVLAFMVGMPQAIFSCRWGSERYRLSMVPLEARTLLPRDLRNGQQVFRCLS